MISLFDEKVMKKITGILDILICLLLFISSVYKGGFYKEDSLFINMIICILGLVCLGVKLVLNIKDNKRLTKSKINTAVDILVMLMPIAYFMPVIFKTYASLESAIFECIRYINFAIIYFIVRSTNNKRIYVNSLVIIGIMIAIFGIDEITFRGIEALLKPLSISYLANSGGRVSATIQYANITALIMLISSIIIQSNLIKDILELNENNSFKFNIYFGLKLFALLVLESTIILTASRMVILLMVLTTLIYLLFLIKNKNSKAGITLVLFVVLAFVLVASIDQYLLVKNYLMVWLTYGISLAIIVLAMVINKFARNNRNIGVAKSKIKVNNKLKLGIILSTLILAVVVLITPTKLYLKDETDVGKSVIKNIYFELTDEITIDVDLDVVEDGRFGLEIFEVNDKFEKKTVVYLNKYDMKDGKFSRTYKISSDVARLQMIFKVRKANIGINSLKINDKEVTLSYKFIPDSVIFKLKDTILMDSNNDLRLSYYIDALKLVNKSPLIGIGGEGFKSRYQEVQDEYYVSSEVHSVPLQIMVEAGIIGFGIYSLMCVAGILMTLKIYKANKKEAIKYLAILLSFVITAMFDLVFSFGVMIYVFAVILGVITATYKEQNIDSKDTYELDNKSALGMLKIATLSISLMILVLATGYSVNMYRASMLQIPIKEEESLYNSYERVGILENKVQLDMYNVNYLSRLLDEYDDHLDLLNDLYMNGNAEQKQLLKNDINNYIVLQKQVADKLIEYEYYNKYVLERVARCYFKHYVSYANIYHYNFKDDEIAYGFYLGYAIKLTERIIEVGNKNKVAKQFVYDIYNEYIPNLKKQNGIIQSEILTQVIEDMTNKFENIKNNI